MLASEYNAWLKFREKYGPLTLHMRIDRAGAVAAQAHRGGALDKYMPWGKPVKADVPDHVMSPAVGVSEYTDAQLAHVGLYRDEKGTIRRKVSNAGKRMVSGLIHDKDDPAHDARLAAAQKAQEKMRGRLATSRKDPNP